MKKGKYDVISSLRVLNLVPCPPSLQYCSAQQRNRACRAHRRAGRRARALRVLAPAGADRSLAEREALTRTAIAEAERAELVAPLPPASSRPLSGSADTRQCRAAGLVKAFDLAGQLAAEVCDALPADSTNGVYELAAAQGVLAGRTVQQRIAWLTDDLTKQNRALQVIIDKHTPPGSRAQATSAGGGEYANRRDMVQRLTDVTKAEEKKALAAVAAATGEVDLRGSEVGSEFWAGPSGAVEATKIR